MRCIKATHICHGAGLCAVPSAQLLGSHWWCFSALGTAVPGGLFWAEHTVHPHCLAEPGLDPDPSDACWAGTWLQSLVRLHSSSWGLLGPPGSTGGTNEKG